MKQVPVICHPESRCLKIGVIVELLVANGTLFAKYRNSFLTNEFYKVFLVQKFLTLTLMHRVKSFVYQ